MNPDALIASTNIERMEQGKRFDPYYLTTLSADAVPIIVESLPEIGQEPVWQDHSLQQEILYKWNTKPKGWRTWNLGRFRAYRSVQTYTNALVERRPEAAQVRLR
jgi:hypothetical protein